MSMAKSLRMVPASASLGLVAPISLRHSGIALSRASAREYDWAGTHVIGQVLKEGTFFMDGIEPLSDRQGQLGPLHGHDSESIGLNSFQDFSNKIALDRIRFDNRQRFFHSLNDTPCEMKVCSNKKKGIWAWPKYL